MSSGKCEGRTARSPWSVTTRRPARTPPRCSRVSSRSWASTVNFQKVTHDIMYTKFCSVPENAPEVCPNVGWLKDFNDGQSMLDPTFNGDNVVPENNSNWPQLDVPEINEAIDEAKLIDDPEERNQAWADVDTIDQRAGPGDPVGLGQPGEHRLGRRGRRDQHVQRELGSLVHVAEAVGIGSADRSSDEKGPAAGERRVPFSPAPNRRWPATSVRRLLWSFLLLILSARSSSSSSTSSPRPTRRSCAPAARPTRTRSQAIRESLGLDKSVLEQFWIYIKGVFTPARPAGDRRPRAALLRAQLPVQRRRLRRDQVATCRRRSMLVTGAVIVWLAIAIPVGIISAVKSRSLLDRTTMITTLAFISAPVFWLGLVALYLFAQDVGVIQIFPGIGSYAQADDFVGKVGSMLLPWAVLAAATAAIYARYLRSQMIDVMGEDYIRTARAKGLPERRVIMKHALRSAITPIVTLLGLDVAVLLAGNAILTETVFNIPGVGAETFNAIKRSDLPMIQGITLFGAFFIVTLNLIVDIALRLPRSEGPLPMSATGPLLRVEDLMVHFDTDEGVVKAVDGVSFDVKRGEMLGIVGESGSGKSVANMTILGLTRAAQRRDLGPDHVRGPRPARRSTDEDLREIRGNQISMIFQDPLSSLHPFYKVGKQLVEAIQVHQDLDDEAAMARAIELLGLVGIPDPERRVGEYPHEFSGGMRQRAMIAMALTNDPKLLIADEPTTALDVTTQAQILRLIERLRQEFGMAVIMITHDLGVVAEVADRVHGHVRRPGGRVGHPRPDLLRPAAPLHLGPARLADPDRQAAHRPPGADRRPAAVADRAPRGLRVPPPLPARLRPSCTQLPPLEERIPERGHADRCWLPPEQKKTLRVVSSGEIGLEEPAA